MHGTYNVKFYYVISAQPLVLNIGTNPLKGTHAGTRKYEDNTQVWYFIYAY